MNVFRWGLWRFADLNQTVLSSFAVNMNWPPFQGKIRLFLDEMDISLLDASVVNNINDSKTLWHLSREQNSVNVL